jgi:DNA-binding response OmpR family regulator
MKYPTTNDHQSFRVLLVDHDVQVLALLTTLLEHYGHDVRSAASCKEALALTDGFRPEVVYTGIALLVSSGFELAKQLRARADCARTVIVALTGHDTLMTPAAWTNAGFNYVLRKPANIEEIVGVLKDVSGLKKSNLGLVQRGE